MRQRYDAGHRGRMPDTEVLFEVGSLTQRQDAGDRTTFSGKVIDTEVRSWTYTGTIRDTEV